MPENAVRSCFNPKQSGEEEQLNLSLKHEQVGAWIVVSAEGEIDMANAGDVETYLTASAQGRELVALDLSAVGFMDSTGLTALIQAYKFLNGSGGSFLLLSPSREVSRVLAVTGLDRLFDILDSVEQLEQVIPLPTPANPRTPTSAAVAG